MDAATTRPATIADGNWHALDAADAIEHFTSDARAGLSADEAKRRRAETGPNALAAADGRAWLEVLVRQFSSALVLILIAAAVLSLFLGDRLDAIAIAAIIVLNAALGFAQEWRAQNAIQALQAMMAPTSVVIRDGKQVRLPAEDLVPGDIVVLEAGDRVPADLRLLEATDLKADESALTGESSAVAKQAASVDPDTPLHARASMLWSGALLTSGRAHGLVVATGARTELGRISTLAAGAGGGTTPLQRKMAALAAQLGAAAIAAAVFAGGLGWAAGWSLSDALITSISISVAIVPEGLPAAVTVTLALGARAMARRNALLRLLQAAETLGAATVICTDKTGTLTRNEMTGVSIWTLDGAVDITRPANGSGVAFQRGGRDLDALNTSIIGDLITSAALCNNAALSATDGEPRAIGDPTEAALLNLALDAGWSPDGAGRRVFEATFSSERKRMAVVQSGENGRVVHVKGALQTLLPRCARIQTDGASQPLGEETRRAILNAHDRIANEGLRVICVARRRLPDSIPLNADSIETDLQLIGLVGLMDPPRREAADAVAAARSAGVSVIMITGDAAETASAIARRIRLPERRATEGRDLAGMSDSELAHRLVDGAVFARATPEDKIRIVSLLQSRGEVVAMTGDGVNDAPALRQADIGVAMGLRGTDTARSSADMVLADDNFASIVNAIEEGRRQRDNIRKFVRYMLASNIGELAAILANLIIGGPLILLPIQILWMNLVTDGPTALALGAEPVERGAMKRRPEPREIPLLHSGAFVHVVCVAMILASAAVALFNWRLGIDPEDENAARTLALTAIILIQKANVFVFRSTNAPIWASPPWVNPWLIAAVVGTSALQLGAVYLPPLQALLHTAPLATTDWLLIGAAALGSVIAAELLKALLSRDANGLTRVNDG